VFNNDVAWFERNGPKISPDLINKQNMEHNTILYEAICLNQTKQVKAILKIKGIEINRRCKDNNTALHMAVKNSNLELVLALCCAEPYPAETDVFNIARQIPLHFATKQFKDELCCQDASKFSMGKNPFQGH